MLSETKQEDNQKNTAKAAQYHCKKQSQSAPSPASRSRMNLDGK